MSQIHVTTKVNGDAAEFLCDADETLLDALRDKLNLTGAKEGCGPGDCGACSVTINGALVCSCLTLAAEAQGREIGTIEGLAKDGKLHPLQQAFLDEQAGQCGYCLSGILISAAALLARNPRPGRREIAAALDRHLCRCGMHNRVLRAVVRAGAAMEAQP